MTASLSEIGPRLEKLILLLSSNQPGEVAAAAAAITRALHGIGRDWHDLAGLVTQAKPQQQWQQEKPRDDSDSDDWRVMRAFCLDHSYALRSREREFIIGLGEWRGDLTDKQYSWLCAIFARVRRAA